MIDGHVHLEKGPLTKEYVYEFVQSAIDHNIDELQILDHTHRFKEFAPIYEECRKIPAQNDWLNRDLKDSLIDYIDLIKECRKENFPIKVSFGLEVCYQKPEEERIKQIVNSFDFDFLVGAVHSIDYIVYDSKWSLEELWKKYDVDYIYKRYYETVFDLVKSDLFTQLAHVDTIKMFNYYPTYDLTDTYNNLCELIKEHPLKVENNVGCYYRYHHKDMGLSDELLRIFKHNNLNMITVSDAHYPKDVGIHIKDVWEKTMK